MGCYGSTYVDELEVIHVLGKDKIVPCVNFQEYDCTDRTVERVVCKNEFP